MTTPADWYPDPEDPASLRYWDGTRWTEHRASAVAPATPAESPAAEPPTPQSDPFGSSEQATSIVSLPDQSTTAFSSGPAADAPSGEEPASGAHRAPDAGGEPAAGSYTPTPSQPYDTHPTTPYEPPSFDSPQAWDAPLPSWDTPAAEPAAKPAAEQPSYAPPPAQSYEQSYEPASFAPPPGPPGSSLPSNGSSGDGPNTKLVIGIIGGAAAVLLAIVLVIVFVVVRKDEPAVTASPTTSSESATSTQTTTSQTETESSETESPLPPPTGAQGSDGDYTFSVASVETGDTITSTVSDAVETTANGQYYVVHLNVANTGAAPLTFVATFQQLSAAGQTFPLDDTATAFLGGTIADIAPGSQVETPLVYDVPVGTEPDSILLRADPVSPGVTLPLQ
ncbi:MAG: DUF2510 domain-containing protein [Mycobacterium sp.]